MEIQQHDDVVVEVAAILARLRQASARGRRVTGGRGRRQGLGCGCPPSPLLYIGSLGGAIPRRSNLQGGRRPRGWLAPQGKWRRPPPLGFPTLGAGEAQGGRTSPPGAGSPPTSAHGSLRDRWPHPVDPRDPSGGPGTIPITPKLSRWMKLDFLYINLHLWTIPELLMTSGISSGTPNNFRVTVC